MFQCFNENVQIYKTVLRWKLENGSRIIFLKYEFERMEYVPKKVHLYTQELSLYIYRSFSERCFSLYKNSNAPVATKIRHCLWICQQNPLPNYTFWDNLAAKPFKLMVCADFILTTPPRLIMICGFGAFMNTAWLYLKCSIFHFVSG